VFSQLFGSFANFAPEVLEVIDDDGVWASGGVSGPGTSIGASPRWSVKASRPR